MLFDSGINFTLGGGFIKSREAVRTDRRYPRYLFGKGGYQLDIFSVGKTNFSVSYGRYDNFSMNKDKGHTAGAAIVQNVSKVNTDLFIKYRLYKLDQVGSRLGNLHMFAAGMRISF